MVTLPPVQQETLEFLLQLGGTATTSTIAETFQVKMHRVNHALSMLLDKGIVERSKTQGVFVYRVRDGWDKCVVIQDDMPKECLSDAFFTNTMRRCAQALEVGAADFHQLLDRTQLPELSLKEDLSALETGHFVRQEGDDWMLTGKPIPTELQTDAGFLSQLARLKSPALWSSSLPVRTRKAKN